MQRRRLANLGVSALLIAVLMASGVLVRSTAAWAADLPTIVEKLTTDVIVQDNGGFTARQTMVIHVTNTAAAAGLGQFPLPYSPTIQPIDAIEAHVEKPDGTRVDVSPDGFRDQSAPGDPSLQMFSDMRQRVVVFPQVAAGDRLFVTWHSTAARPRVPGGFQFSNVVFRSFPWNDITTTISVPPGQMLQVDADGFAHTSEVVDGRTIHHMHASYPQPLANDVVVRGPYSRWPHFYASTFPDWNAFAASYATVLMPHVFVTPKLQQLADQITLGITDRRAQAEALYTWVRDHIRYVNVMLGNGGIDPHDAADIAGNGFGDCKDHVVILHTLLAAKGIAGAMVVINLGNESGSGAVATLAPFNHLITYLPDFDLYVDSTNSVAPFGALLLNEAGKPVMVVGDEGKAKRTTPVPDEAMSVSELAVQASMDDAGVVSGSSTTTARGPLALALRLIARSYEAAGKGAAAAARLKQLGSAGTGSFAFDAPAGSSDEYTVAGTFTLEKEPSLLDGQSFTLWTGLRVLDRPGDALLGPLFQRGIADSEATFCYPGRQKETLSLTLPDGRELDKLPKDLTLDSPLFHFASHWSLEGQTVTVRREFVSHVPGPLCEGATRKTVAASLGRIRDDYNRRVEIK